MAFDTSSRPTVSLDPALGAFQELESYPAPDPVLGAAAPPTISVQAFGQVLLNANDDNFQPPAAPADPNTGRWKSASQVLVPAKRDFNATNLPKDDNDLQEMTITVGGGYAGTVTVSEYNPGEGGISFWNDRKKNAPFAPVDLAGGKDPQTVKLYVEGDYPSQSEDDVSAIAYFTLKQDPRVVVKAEQKFSVIPFLVGLDYQKDVVRFKNGRVDGKDGLDGGKYLGKNNPNNVPGITMIGQAFNNNQDLFFIQNLTNVVNRENRSAAGAVDANPANSKNLLPEPGSGIVMPGAVLDSPDKSVSTLSRRIVAQTATTKTVTGEDTPGLGPPDGQGPTITTYDVKETFSAYFVVVFPRQGMLPTIYTLGTVDWNINFFATRSKAAANAWTDTIEPTSVITVTAVTKNHDDPLKTSGSIANDVFKWQ